MERKIDDDNLLTILFVCFRLKEQASKGAAAKRKTAAGKKSKKSQAEKDAELAKKLSSRRESTRDKDAKGAKSKKAAALAALKKEKKIQKQREESDDSEIDFADDSDDDSDDDYDEDDTELKPWQKKAKAAKAAAKSSSVLDKVDDDSDSEDEDDENAATKTKREKRASSTPAVEAGVEDFKKCTVPRRRLARWCSEPFFEAAVLNCFVRVLIGENEQGEKVYRLCEITDVKTGIKAYKFPIAKRGDKPIMTNKMITLRFGKHEKDFPMSLVSDAHPDELDVRKYVSAMRNIREEVLTKREANKLARLQHDLVHNYRYTTEDIEKNLQQLKKQGKSRGNLGAEQTKAAIAVQAARDMVAEAERNLADAKRTMMETDDEGDDKAVQEASEALKEAQTQLEERLAEERRTLDVVENRKKMLSQRSKDRNWAKVNQRALEANQKADREANKTSESKASGPGKKESFNPYARRRVKPKILWEVGQDDDDAEQPATAATDATGQDPSPDIPTPSLVQELDDKVTTINDDHQFAIDEEELAQQNAGSSALFGRAKKVSRKRKRQGISLAEYLDKKSKGEL